MATQNHFSDGGSGAVVEFLGPAFDGGTVLRTGDQPVALAAGDFNADGHIDLAVGFAYASVVDLLAGSGDGGFNYLYYVQEVMSGGVTTNSLSGLALGDFNEDGTLDVAVSNGAASVEVFVGDRQGHWSDGGRVTCSSSTRSDSIVASDFGANGGDGHLDLAIGYENVPTKLGVAMGAGDGTFSSATLFDAGNQGVTGFAVGDFNEDGANDLVMASGSTFGSMAFGLADGGFSQPESLGIEASSVAVADVNADGHQDILVGSGRSDGEYLDLLLGWGDGGFADGGELQVGDAGSFSRTLVVVGDFDGGPDIVVGDENAGELDVISRQCR